MKLASLFRAFRLGVQVPRNLLYQHFLHSLPILSFNFEVTRRCASNCIYCNIHKTQSKREDELTPDEIREYLKPASLFKRVKEVGITGGEPTLRSDLLEVCQALKEACPSASLGFPTNCLAGNVAEVAVRIRDEVDPSFHVGLSLDGPREVSDGQRGVKGHFDKVFRVAEALKEAGVPFGFCSTLTMNNLKVMGAFRRELLAEGFAHSYDMATESETFYKNTGCIDAFGLLKADKTEVLPYLFELAKIGKTTSYRYFLPFYVKEPHQLFPCFSGFASFFLNYSGEVYPCIHLNRSFGNLRQSKFADLWKGQDATDIRRWIHDKKCHCWTGCESSVTVKSLCYPALIKKLGIGGLLHGFLGSD